MLAGRHGAQVPGRVQTGPACADKGGTKKERTAEADEQRIAHSRKLQMGGISCC